MPPGAPGGAGFAYVELTGLRAPVWLCVAADRASVRSMRSYSWLKGTKSIEQLIWFHFTSFSKAFGSRIRRK